MVCATAPSARSATFELGDHARNLRWPGGGGGAAEAAEVPCDRSGFAMSLYVSRHPPERKRIFGQRRLSHRAIELSKQLVPINLAGSQSTAPPADDAATAEVQVQMQVASPSAALSEGSNDEAAAAAAREKAAANAARARAAREKREAARAAEKAKREEEARQRAAAAQKKKEAAKAAAEQKRKQAVATAEKAKLDAAAKAAAAAADVKPHPQGCITQYEFNEIKKKMMSVEQYLAGTGKGSAFFDGMEPVCAIEKDGMTCRAEALMKNGRVSVQTAIVFNDVPASILWKLNTNIERQTEWDDYLKSKEVIASVGDNDVVYHVCYYPTPMSNRDYVYFSKSEADAAAGTFLMFQRDVPDLGEAYRPVTKKPIRAGRGDFFGIYYIRSTGPKSSVMLYITRDNPAGSIPGWVVSFAAKKGVPGWMKRYKKAAVALMKEEGLI
eukprot:SAG31_NODE_7_length_42755_cov_130.245728_13_plen_441_part_00